MINDFLDDEESLVLLECADAVIFAYQQTGESASAAVKHGLAANRPVLCTPLEIFDDVSEFMYSLPGFTPSEIAAGILEFLALPEHKRFDRTRQETLRSARSWNTLGQRLAAILQALRIDREIEGFSTQIN